MQQPEQQQAPPACGTFAVKAEAVAERGGRGIGAAFRSRLAGGGDLNRTCSNNIEMCMKADRTRKAFQRPAWWVLIFGWSLAMCAGIVNAASFRTFGHFVSHATGGTTSIALGIEGVSHGRHGWEKPVDAAALLAAFILGAFACGLLIDKNQVHLGGKALYGAALVGNALLLIGAVAAYDETEDTLLPACFAAAACGLQNAMCTSHFGAVVRTTHVTGTLTDIGSTAGRMAIMFLRKGCRRARLNVLECAEIAVDARKMLVLGPMWFAFFLGTMVGAYLQNHVGVYALMLPALLTLSVGLTYMLFRQRLKDQFKKMEGSRLRKEVEEINETLSRAQSFVHDYRLAGSKRRAEDGAVAGLEEEFGHMLETMQQVEAELEEMYHRRGRDTDGGAALDIETGAALGVGAESPARAPRAGS